MAESETDGSIVRITTRKPATLDLAGIKGLFTDLSTPNAINAVPVANVVEIGVARGNRARDTMSTITNGQRVRPGILDRAVLPLTMALDPEDAGQNIIIDAVIPKTRVYFHVESPDTNPEYYGAYVLGAGTNRPTTTLAQLVASLAVFTDVFVDKVITVK